MSKTQGASVDSERRSPRLPPLWSRVTIVGLGLLGGSLAAVLRRAIPHIEIVGVDAEKVLQSTEAKRLVDRGILVSDRPEVMRAFGSSDLVFLSATIGGIKDWLPAALDGAALVTDCGSTKRGLVEVASQCTHYRHFVPGHPMAGALGGLSGATADLFVDQPWVLCPQNVESEALRAVQVMVEMTGALPTFMTPQEHDRVVATTSHVPRLMASSLARIAAENQAFGAAGPAFERLVRGAGGSTAMWADILKSNRDEVVSALRLLIGDLEQCAQELSAGSELPGVIELLETAERARLDFKKLHRNGK